MFCLRHHWKQRDGGRNTWLLPHFRPSCSLQGSKLSRINGKGATEMQIAGLLGQLPVVPSRAGERQEVDLRAKKQVTGMTH